MILGLILSGILVAANNMPMASGDCAVVNQMQGKMLPNSTDPFIHGALLYFNDDFAGAVYGTRLHRLYYQDVGKFSKTISDASRARALSLFGINRPTGHITQAPNTSVEDFLAPDVRLKGCF